MRNITALLFLCAASLHAGPIWIPSWSDEFTGPANTAPDGSKWTYDLTNNGGWGNSESQYYTNRTVNARTDGAGRLIIEARAESYMGFNYTSARLKTKGIFAQQYGRLEARMRITYSQGIWPAFWMLGDSFPGTGWPACGEIDIMENVGFEPDIVHGTVHGPGYSGGAGIGLGYDYGSPLSAGFHDYVVEWDPNIIRWYLDGVHYHDVYNGEQGANTWVFNQPFFMILNVAVGGTWPGYPDGTTVLPQQLQLEYVRLYTRDTTQRNYFVTPQSLPLTVQVEEFDDGSMGVAYNDNSYQNQGGFNVTRTSEAVDLEATTDAGGGWNLGYTNAGEWLEYTLSVPSTGNYTLEVRVAKQGAGGNFHFNVDGTPLANANFTVPDTGGWQNWTTLGPNTVALTAGTHVFRLAMDTEGTGTSVGNFNWFRFTSLNTPTPTFTRTPTRSPTRTLSSTPSPTLTRTATLSETPSPSPSGTPTHTPTLSPTEVLSPTPSFTVSETATPSFPASPTPSFSHSPTDTITETFSFSPSATLSLTPSHSPSESPTETPSPSSTATETLVLNSETPTPTPSPTFSLTRTLSPSLTPPPSQSKVELRAVQPLPNPQSGPGLSFRIDSGGPLDRLRLRLYSTALTCAYDAEIPLAPALGWSTALFPDLGLASGLYFYEMQGSRGSELTELKLGKLMLLK